MLDSGRATLTGLQRLPGAEGEDAEHSQIPPCDGTGTQRHQAVDCAGGEQSGFSSRNVNRMQRLLAEEIGYWRAIRIPAGLQEASNKPGRKMVAREQL